MLAYPAVITMQEFLPIGRFSELEAANFDKLKTELRGSIQKGIDFVHKGAITDTPAL